MSDSPASSVNSPVQQLALPSPLTSIIPQSTNIHPMITRSKGGIVKPRVWHAQYKIQISISTEPTSFRHAVKCAKWGEAMDKEYKAFG